jgi:hypothetical protein
VVIAVYGGDMPGASRYRELGEAGWAWVLGQVRHDNGPWLPEVVGDDPPQPAQDRDSLYSGIAGLAPVLAELGRHRELNGAETALAAGIIDRLDRTSLAERVDASLYDTGRRSRNASTRRCTTGSPVTSPRCGCWLPGGSGW